MSNRNDDLGNGWKASWRSDGTLIIRQVGFDGGPWVRLPPDSASRLCEAIREADQLGHFRKPPKARSDSLQWTAEEIAKMNLDRDPIVPNRIKTRE